MMYHLGMFLAKVWKPTAYAALASGALILAFDGSLWQNTSIALGIVWAHLIADMLLFRTKE